MAERELFREDNKKVDQLYFAIKLATPALSLTEGETRTLLKKLRRRDKKLFKNCTHLFNPDLKSGIIVDRKNRRSIVMDSENIKYSEVKDFNNETFNRVSKYLYEFYTETKSVETDDFKLIGKVFTFIFDIGQSTKELVRARTGLFRDQDISIYELKTVISMDPFQLHLKISTPKEEDVDIANTMQIIADFNNLNQEDGLEPGAIDDIPNFADKFVRDELLDLLNNNFS